MAYGGTSTGRSDGIAKLIATVFEAVGVLNKGSAAAPAAPTADETSRAVQPISTNALNVTRVTGLAALISAVGPAALAIFRVDTTNVPETVAAYGSVGAIVAAALITAAIVVSADIRSRASIATTTAGPAGRRQVRTIAAATTLDMSAGYVRIDTSGGAVNVSLPDATAATGFQVTLRKISKDPDQVVIRTQAGQAIDGAAQQLLAADGDKVTLLAADGNWESV